MARLAFADVNVGDTLQPLALPPSHHAGAVRGASGDHMPLHIDIDVARKAACRTCSGTACLSMAYLGRL